MLDVKKYLKERFEILLTPKEVMEITKLSHSHIRQLSRENKFPKPVYLSEKQPRYKMAEFEEWWNERLGINQEEEGEECP